MEKNNLKAVVFDLDGVLTDSVKISLSGLEDAGRQAGHSLR